jgi:hypothetical protein
VGSLSKTQSDIVIGTMLGDGYMRCKTNAHLQITHSINQKEYVDWMYGVLKNCVLTQPKPYKGNGKRIGYRFFTRSLPCFTDIYKQFYKDKRKIIPPNLKLNEQILAVWYMDDGSLCDKSCYLNTQQFPEQEQLLLSRLLLKDFGLTAKRDKDKQYYRLRFNVKESKKFVDLIRPYIIPSMAYKVLI